MLIINGRVFIFRASSALTAEDGRFFILFNKLVREHHGT